MKRFTKIIAAILAVLISAGATAAYAYATNDGIENKDEEAPAATTAAEKDEPRVASDTAKAEKEETVYVLSGADGSTNKIIVSDWLKNAGALDSIADVSSLTGIENVKGDEAFTQDGDKLTWNANGADIYYKGTSDKALPVTLKVTYYLDGNEIAPNDLAGKSGHVKIRYDYINNQKTTVKIDGKDTDVYVPFVVATGAVLDNSKFLNIEITNGKVISDGDKSIVAGFALSGVKESLGLENSDIDLPQYVEIDADVTDFELSTTVTLAMNPTLDTDKLSGEFNADELSSALSQATDAATQLSDGSNAIYNGLSELLDKSSDLISGIDALYNGAVNLQDGADTLSAGAEQLGGGIASAKTGADALATGGAQLEAGAGQLVTGITGVEQGASQLSGGIDTAAQSLDTTIAANKQILTGLQAVYAQTKSADVAKMISTLQQTIAGQEQIAASMKAGGALKTGADTLAAGASQLKTGADALATGVTQSAAGAKQLSDGMAALSDGSAQLENGADAISTGAAQLTGGLSELKTGSAALVDGVTKLKNGAGELKDGIAQFSSKITDTVADVFSGDLDSLSERLSAITDASKAYTSYSGTSADMNGSVKFIFTTDTIGND